MSDEPAAITWERDPNVLWYHLWVGNASYDNVIYFDWIDATTICDETTCTFDVDDFAFPNDDYEVWAQLCGPGGYIKWLQVNGGEPATFTVDTSE